MIHLRARYVFPVESEPIPDGFVTLDGDRIAAVGTRPGWGELHDLGNAAILPGLVNAHAHLDFSRLDAPLGAPGIGFVDWLRRVMDYRQSTAPADSLEAPDRPSPVVLGLKESLRHGVAAVGDIAQPDWPFADATSLPLNITAFLEIIGPTPDRASAALESANQYLAQSRSSTSSDSRRLTASGNNFLPHNLLLGLSPHAPYSVRLELLTELVALSAARQAPIAMHLAESREELELLERGTGPLRNFLEDIDAWDAAAFRSGGKPLDYLHKLARAHRALVIHGNYLDDEEIAFLGARAATITAVYCPRTHERFAHDPYPLEKMLSAGATVALGTDGRGTSPDLNLLAEMRCAARRNPDVARSDILRMATLNGAKALGWSTELGAIAPGKRAALTVVPLPDCDAADPHELLFDSDAPAWTGLENNGIALKP